MASIFIVMDCKKRKPIFVTQSACKAVDVLKNAKSGLRVEVWNNNALVIRAYCKELHKLDTYVKYEKQYIGMKQKRAEERNKLRRSRYGRS